MHRTYAEHWLTQDLTPGAKTALYEIGEIVGVQPDDVVIEADEPNPFLYLLLEGAFKVYLPPKAARKNGRTLGHRGPGDVLGEYSFMDAFQPIARVTASTPGQMLRIGHDPMRELLASDAGLGATVYRNMLRYLVVRLRVQDEEMESLMF